ncbi:MAG: hypothetical protein Q9203_005803 [Teloschistes exilis]
MRFHTDHSYQILVTLVPLVLKDHGDHGAHGLVILVRLVMHVPVLVVTQPGRILYTRQSTHFHASTAPIMSYSKVRSSYKTKDEEEGKGVKVKTR